MGNLESVPNWKKCPAEKENKPAHVLGMLGRASQRWRDLLQVLPLGGQWVPLARVEGVCGHGTQGMCRGGAHKLGFQTGKEFQEHKGE